MAHEVKSPIPGTFYRRPSPDEPPYKDIGDTVAVGDTVGLVEVMKMFHEIKADGAGKLLRFEVENGATVMAGQVLVVLEA